MKRAFLPSTDVSGTENETGSGKDNGMEEMNNIGDRNGSESATEPSDPAYEAENSMTGQWVAFHSACL